MRSPLIKRVPREFIKDYKKYLAVFLFLVLMISLAAGDYVASDSMMSAVNGSYEKYNTEDGNFRTDEAMSDELIASIESGESVDASIDKIANTDNLIDDYLEETDIDEIISEFKENATQEEALYIDETIKTLSDDEIKEMVKSNLSNEEFLDEIRSEIFKEYEDKEVSNIKIYENFYMDVDEDINEDGKRDATIRVFKIRDEVNKACVNEGRLPENKGEIAIDRMHADNRKLEIGDKISVAGKNFEIVGLVALPDYTTLYQKNTDSMFDAINFNVSLVKDEDFDDINGKLYYSYSFKYDEKPDSEKEEKEISEDLMESLARKVMINGNSLEDYVPNYANNAIQFAPGDLGNDSVMMKILVYILIAVIAFIFAVTINNTIENESAVIGTLRASGYSRGELIRHYLSVPVVITLAAALVGNILGYTIMKNLVVGLYYNSYSLPKYETLWNQKAFIETTVIPIVLMLVINTYMIYRKLRLSPLKFLRHDLSKHKHKKAMRLPRISFFGRFRLRILLQNKISYFIMAFGIFFTTALLIFATVFPNTLDHYKDTALEEVLSKYQYVLKTNEDEDGNPIKTKNKDAKYVAINTLITNDKYEEEVMIYGMDMDETKELEYSESEESEVLVSNAYRDKYGVKKGDTIKIKEKYEGGKYELKVKGYYNSGTSIAVFMNADEYAKVFDEDEGYFNSILSESEVNDIDDKYIYMSVTPEDVTKISRQLEHSLGGYMDIFKVFCFALALVLMYLLTKIIIEKNAQSISMVKVLGYTNGEVNKLYILTTALVVLFVTVISEILAMGFMSIVWAIFLKEISGYIPMYISASGMILVYAIVIAAFAIVTFFDVIRIKKVPLTAALKNVE